MSRYSDAPVGVCNNAWSLIGLATLIADPSRSLASVSPAGRCGLVYVRNGGGGLQTLHTGSWSYSRA